MATGIAAKMLFGWGGIRLFTNEHMMPDVSPVAKTPHFALTYLLSLHSAPGLCNAARMARDTNNKNPAAVALGRLGGLRGGKARARMLTAAERKRIAKRAAKARWKKKSALKR